MAACLWRGRHKTKMTRPIKKAVLIQYPLHRVGTGEMIGPNRDGLCPCGSRRRSRSCHSNRAGHWIESTEPLLSGERTGIRNKHCYAESSADCSGKISSEHWLSKNILKSINPKGSIVSGLASLEGKAKPLPPEALGSKILCDRHNSKLSPLDDDVGDFFRALHRFQDCLAQPSPSEPNEFLLLSGSRLELWLLKLTLGGLASKSFGSEGKPILSVGGAARRTDLIEILFRGGPWPTFWGFHAFPHQVDPDGERVAVAIDPKSFPEGLAGVSVLMGVVKLDLTFGVPEPAGFYRPGAIILTRAGYSFQKVIGLAWPGGGGRPIHYECRGTGSKGITGKFLSGA